ncbi:sensor histidine kinase [Psychrobacter sp. AH5]|uniref:sensor histidine kinase n=1 Tax=Psychrobacter sp. AH5 TaxID=2937433 RepID=UPI00334267F3
MIKQLILLIGLIIMSSMAWSTDKLMPIEGQWQFYQTDNITLSYSDVPDSDWQVVYPPKLLSTNAKHGIYGWYQVSFDWTQATDKDWLLYLQSIRYADETWLNGQRIGGLGQILKPWDFNTSNPQNMARKYTIPPNLLKPSNNLLAVKVNLGIGQAWGAMYPGGVGIGGNTIGIGQAQSVYDIYTKRLIKSTRFDTILIVLGVIDIFIIVFLFRKSIHHFREFWWLLISSLSMLCGSLLLDHYVVLESPPNGLNLLLILSILIVPFTSALYFQAVYHNLSKHLIWFITAIGLILIGLIIIPNIATSIKEYSWLGWTALATVTYLYCLLSVLYGIKQRCTGAMVQLIGLVIYIASIRTQWLPNDLFEHRNIIIGTLIFRYALLFSYFQRITEMSSQYKQLSKRLLTTIEDHKKEIARDLHDDLGQHLSAAKLQLLLYHQGETKVSIHFIQQEINAAIQSTREIMEGLHPVFLEHYRFDEALNREVTRLQRLYPVAIELTMGKVKLEKKIEKQLFRIIQEALHNAIRHGQASFIKVQLLVNKNQIKLVIRDNGLGFDPKNLSLFSKQYGFGLVSLHERVALINGQLQLSSKKGKGTTISIILAKKH